MKEIASFYCIIFSVALSLSAEATDKKEILELSHFPRPEIPARAAEIVRQTPAKERPDAAVLIVETVLARYPAMAGPLVSAIAKAAPESWPLITAAAARVVPASASEIDPTTANGGSVNQARKPLDGETGRGSDNGKGGNGNGNGNGGGSKVGNGGNGKGHGDEGGANHSAIPPNSPGHIILDHDSDGHSHPEHPEHPEHPPHPVHPPHPIHYDQPGHD